MTASAPDPVWTAGTTPAGATAMAAAAGAAVVVGAAAGRPVLVAVVLVLQGLLVVSAVACLVPSWRGGPLLVGAGASLACTVAVVTTDERPLGRVAGVLGLAVVLSVLLELARRDRSRVAAALTVSVSAATLGACLAAYVALRGLPGGAGTVAAAGAGLTVAVPVRRLLARTLAAVPEAVPAAFAVAAAVLAGSLAGTVGDAGPGPGALLALAAAVPALAAEHLVRTSALPTRLAAPVLIALLPVAAAAPTVYLLGRAVGG